jgi:cytidine deaminase
MIDNVEYSDLIEAAVDIRSHSYSPYSNFKVGAALLGKSGKVYCGTNVENASFGLSICAERAAIFMAVAAGEKEFEAIAVVADGKTPTAPCGACRQVLLEFGLDMVVILASEDGTSGPVTRHTVGELVPHAFVTFVQNSEEGSRD